MAIPRANRWVKQGATVDRSPWQRVDAFDRPSPWRRPWPPQHGAVLFTRDVDDEEKRRSTFNFPAKIDRSAFQGRVIDTRTLGRCSFVSTAKRDDGHAENSVKTRYQTGGATFGVFFLGWNRFFCVSALVGFVCCFFTRPLKPNQTDYRCQDFFKTRQNSAKLGKTRRNSVKSHKTR